MSVATVAGRVFDYEGCFGASNSEGFSLVQSSGAMTIEMCLAECVGNAYAGIAGT